MATTSNSQSKPLASRITTVSGVSALEPGVWLALAAAAGLLGYASGSAIPSFGLVLAMLAPTLIRRFRAAGGVKRLGAYTLEEKLGEGGMGVVYKATHALLERPAAIKLLAPGRASEHDLRRFEREVQLTSRLSHPNAIAIYDFGRTLDGAFYYAMEYVDGQDLQTLVEREGPQSPARVARLLKQLAGALAEAHGAGLVHRDVKPANLMLAARGDALKLLDFGLTKLVDDPSDVTQTDPGSVLGTPLYLSPEALLSPERVDARSDLYALGAVGYFLLTGVPPFDGTSALQVCAQHLHDTPVAPSERLGRAVPALLEDLILACLEKSPGARPESATLVERVLGELLASSELEPRMRLVA